jgi:hypothetical protein
MWCKYFVIYFALIFSTDLIYLCITHLARGGLFFLHPQLFKALIPDRAFTFGVIQCRASLAVFGLWHNLPTFTA